MTEPRYDWTIDEVLAVIERPFHDLLAAAHACHRERFDPHEIEGAKLLSIKTGASSISLGDRLLTADNNGADADAAILDQLDVSVRPLEQRVAIES